MEVDIIAVYYRMSVEHSVEAACSGYLVGHISGLCKWCAVKVYMLSFLPVVTTVLHPWIDCSRICLYTISQFWNRSQENIGQVSPAICLHGNSADV